MRLIENGSGILRALSISSGHELVLPLLRELIVEQLNDPEGYWAEEKHSLWWSDVTSMLELRKRYGRSVCTLRLTGQWGNASLVGFDQSVEEDHIRDIRLLVDELQDERVRY